MDRLQAYKLLSIFYLYAISIVLRVKKQYNSYFHYYLIKIKRRDSSLRQFYLQLIYILKNTA